MHHNNDRTGLVLATLGDMAQTRNDPFCVWSTKVAKASTVLVAVPAIFVINLANGTMELWLVRYVAEYVI